jgi:protein O-mannosyl-transferase
VSIAGVRWFLGLFVGCLLASLAVYAPALRGDYIWDDRDIYILNNPLLPQPDGLYRFWFTTEPLDYYPLAYTVYWFGVRLWGLNPLGFHLTNVVVHALAGALLAWTLKGLRFPAAALVGLLFVVHPMNVESVAWISQLKTCLAGMLAFAAAGCFIRGWMATALVCFVLSLSSKPIAVAFPVAVLLCGWWRDGRIGRSIILQSLPFFAASLIFGAIGVYFQQANAIGPTTIRTDSTLTRLLASSWAVWFYVWKGLVPINNMFVYPRWNIPAAGVFGFIPAILLFAVVGWCWVKRDVWGRTPLAVIVLYLLMILPSSGLVDVYYWRYTYVGDHYAYQALPVVLAAAVGAVWLLLRRRISETGQQPLLFARLASVAVTGFLAVQSLKLSKDYKDDVTLWQATLRRNPGAWLAHTNLASKMLNMGESEKAEPHTKSAFGLRPDLGESHNNMGLMLTRKDRHEEAVEFFREAAKRSPYESLMWENLGIELAHLGRDEEALEMLKKAVDVSAATRWTGPKNARPLCEYANQLSLMDRFDDAMKAFQQAGELRPEEPLVPIGMGHAFARRGMYQQAADEYRRALEIAPRNPNAWFSLGRMQERLGDQSGAFESMKTASAQSTDAFLSFAWMRAASPKAELRDPAAALADAEATQPAGVHAAMVYDVNAVALAANGRFDEAVLANERALEACRQSRVKDLLEIKAAIARLEHRGNLYRSRQPYVGPSSDMTPTLARQISG